MRTTRAVARLRAAVVIALGLAGLALAVTDAPGAAVTEAWVQRYTGPGNNYDEGNAVAVDASGNVVVTGRSSNGANEDYYTAKYAAASGALLWEKRYNGPANSQDYAQAVAVDASGNVVVTGYSIGIGGVWDYYTAKYAAASGALLWETLYNGPANSDDYAQAVAVDASGNVVVTGASVGIGANLDYYTAKYAAASGALLWETRYNGTGNGNDYPLTSRALATGPGGAVVVTGRSYGTGTGDDCATVKYVDIVPPILTCSTNRFVSVSSPTGAVVNFTVTATDDSGLPPTIVCTPASGTVFRLGVTTVNCTATDGDGASSTCSFTVTVDKTYSDGFSSFVPVVNAGNANDPATGYGAVGYNFAMGKYETTLDQYIVFLNAVAASDPYGLYHPSMATDLNVRGIARNGAPGSYTYSVLGDGARPVSYVNWFDAARFANWMHNGRPSGPLNAKRYYHTATLLPNGQVLVAGGDNGGALSSVELYEPTTGKWTPIAAMGTARTFHTATVLPNGKVLVAGGFGTVTTELYDPATGAWTASGAMNAVRVQHTATLLPNGKVLVAGGGSGVGIGSASAELFDPSTGTWTLTGALDISRQNHTATLLPNGKVLIAGGINNNGSQIASAELYDPATGTWTTTSALTQIRNAHTATLLPNGKVLVVGGYGSGALASAELYDPAAGTWTASGALGNARYFHTATLLTNGKVLVAGGAGVANYLTSAEVFDPATGTWAETGALTTARNDHTATLLSGGKLLVTGGQGIGGVNLSGVELFNPATGLWTSGGAQTSATTEDGAYTLNGAMSGVSVAKNAGARYWIPSENEWYKAAYHQPASQGGDSDDYWLYPTASNVTPNSRNGSTTDANSANIYRIDGLANGFNDGYAVTGTDVSTYSPSQNYLTPVGAFTLARSFYGTFDQGGNLWEWTSTPISGNALVYRGGVFAYDPTDHLVSTDRNGISPESEIALGFRLAAPMTLVLPVLVQQPQSLTNVSGTPATFSVVANNNPTGYQWWFNSTLLAGMTNSTLSLTASPGTAGNYFVVVGNLYGAITSDVATLTMIGPVLGVFAGPSVSADSVFQFLREDYSRHGQLILGSDGRLYGASRNDDVHPAGTLSRLERDGTGYTVLHEFQTDGVDGTWPSLHALLEASDGKLYGSTFYGGTNSHGTIFRLNKNGSGYEVIYHFINDVIWGDAEPKFELLEGQDGALYGSTANNVFRINKDGSGHTVLYHYPNYNEEEVTSSIQLIQGSDGKLYGTASYGGDAGFGTVFKLNTNGTGFTLLVSFGEEGISGRSPRARLLEGSDGLLYGTAAYGGGIEGGTVFRVHKDRMVNDATGHEVLHTFGGVPNNGLNPFAPVVEGADGALYGTTRSGTAGFYYGTIYKLNKNGTGYGLLHHFDPVGDGGPLMESGLVQDAEGTFYGSYRVVETSDPSAIFKLSRGSTPLADGQGTALDFGTTLPVTPVTRSLTLTNSGQGALTITGITAPAGYTVLNAPSSLAVAAAVTFQVRLDAAAVGTFAGPVHIFSDDAAATDFDFPVTGVVEDTVAPSITCPGNLALKTPSVAGHVVSYTVAASDNAGTPTVVCTPPSGALFPLGLTTVNCVATDAAGNSNACSFTVTVTLCSTNSFLVNQVVADDDIAELAGTQRVSSPIGAITDLNVTLLVTNGWNGDLYAYLVHDSGFSVLLNRVGRTSSDSTGYDDAGFDVTFDDQGGTNDIHRYGLTFSGDPVTGAWRTDGRETDPDFTLDTDARTALLSSFNGLNPNGEWTLFIADLEAGDISTLVSWGLEICGTAGVAPVITNAPVSLTVECPASVNYLVGASGTQPVWFQWHRNGTPLAGQTNLTLALVNLHPGDSANYTVAALNYFGSVTSAVAVLTVADTTPPVVALTGSPTVTVECHDPLTDLGATASDTCAGALVVTTSGSVDVNTPGVYTLTYSATDSAGNNGSTTRTVTVVDTTPPVVTRNGAATLTVECHTSFTDTGATASDTCAGALAVTTTGSVDANTPGVYTLTYSATDPSANNGSTTRTVTVVDITPPVVTRNGAAAMTVECHTPFTDPGATASDTCAGPLTVTTSGSVDANTPGTYTLTYFAIDPAGNSNGVTRLVTVMDTTPPVLTAPANVTMQCDGDVPPANFAGGSVSDLCDGGPVITHLGDASTGTNPRIITRAYRAVDASGNATTNTQLITVHDTLPPSIVGPAPVVVPAVPGLCAAINVALGMPVTSDNCGVAAVTNDAPAVFPIGTTIVTWTATDMNGFTATSEQSVTVIEVDLPVITSQPQSVTNPPGSTATFSVAATGCTNLFYQWCHGTHALANATNATLVIPSVMLGDAGDYVVKVSNGAGSVTSQVAVLTANRPPVANDNGAGARQDQILHIKLAKLLADDTDADGDLLTVVAVSAASTNGGTVALTSTNVSYTPPAGFHGVDAFSYTISDGQGGTATANVVIYVVNGALPGQNQMALSIVPGGVLVRFAGIPGRTYLLQRAGMVTGPWGTLTTLTTPIHGIMEYIDAAPPTGMGFYRTLRVQ